MLICIFFKKHTPYVLLLCYKKLWHGNFNMTFLLYKIFFYSSFFLLFINISDNILVEEKYMKHIILANPVSGKKKGKIYEKSKKSYCADFDRDVMHAAADGSADRGCRWGKTSGCIIYA